MTPHLIHAIAMLSLTVAFVLTVGLSFLYQR
jgi:hypothetical protein